MISNKHSFDSCFEVFLADTPESKRIHYNLRYQVYCDEMGFEDKESFPEQMEFDEWDNSSVHFMVRHRYSGQWVAALRLVHQHQLALPFEDKCTPYEPITAQQYRHSVELSRLCVLKDARRFALGKNNLSSEVSANEIGNIRYLHSVQNQNQNRSIMWGLYRAAVVYSAENDIKHWYTLVTPPLAYCGKKQGFEMLPVGGSCEHRGKRSPYLLEVQQVLANPLWDTDYQLDYRLYSELTERSISTRQRA